MLDFEAPLQAIEITDVGPPEENLILNADFPMSQKLGAVFYLTSAVVVLSVASSFFFPTPRSVRTTPERFRPLGPNIMSIGASVTNLSGTNQYVAISIAIPVAAHANFSVVGNLSVWCLLGGSVVHGSNESKSLVVSDSPVLLVVDETIDFDTISLQLNLSPIKLGKTPARFHIETRNSVNSLGVSAARGVIFVSLLPYLLRQLCHLSRPFTLEQQLTVSLAVGCLFLVNPIAPLRLWWPSKLMQLATSLTRDAFHAFFGFYCLALLCYFGRQPDDNQLLSLAMPYLFLSIWLIVLMVQNELPADPLRLWPAEFDPRACGREAIYFAILFIVFVAAVAFANRQATLDRRRWRFYVWGTLAFLVVIAAFWATAFLVEAVRNAAVAELFPVGIFALFCLLFGAAHEAAEEAEDFAYEAHQDGEQPENADLGAEEDVDALKRPKAPGTPEPGNIS